MGEGGGGTSGVGATHPYPSLKNGFLIMLFCAITAYSAEFAMDQFGKSKRVKKPGFISLFALMLIILAYGLFAHFWQNFWVAAFFVPMMMILVVADAVFVGAKFCIVVGALTLVSGFLYAATVPR